MLTALACLVDPGACVAERLDGPLLRAAPHALAPALAQSEGDEGAAGEGSDLRDPDDETMPESGEVRPVPRPPSEDETERAPVPPIGVEPPGCPLRSRPLELIV